MNARAVLLSAALALFAIPASASPPSIGIAADLSPSTHADGFILLSPGSQSVTMSGSIDDVRRARSLRADGEGLLYVRQGGLAYVIRDAATLRRAQALFEPQKALGAQQGELGARQAALGQQQARLGAQQARLGLRQASTSPRDAEALARQQDDLGRQQNALGQQQNALGRQQDALGREQDRLGRIAEGQLRILSGEAIRSGLAQRVE